MKRHTVKRKPATQSRTKIVACLMKRHTAKRKVVAQSRVKIVRRKPAAKPRLESATLKRRPSLNYPSARLRPAAAPSALSEPVAAAAIDNVKLESISNLRRKCFIAASHRRYFALRHGESEASVAHKIISDPDVGVPRYGLTERGKEMVVELAARFKANILELQGIHPNDVAVLSSDFKRASETASILCEELGITPHVTSGVYADIPKLLRERRFGNLEAGPDSNYHRVWQADADDPEAIPFDSESCASVQQRMVSAVWQLEQLPPRIKIAVLVSHGDALQILQTAFECISAGHHRTLTPLACAELRELVPAARG